MCRSLKKSVFPLPIGSGIGASVSCDPPRRGTTRTERSEDDSLDGSTPRPTRLRRRPRGVTGRVGVSRVVLGRSSKGRSSPRPSSTTGRRRRRHRACRRPDPAPPSTLGRGHGPGPCNSSANVSPVIGRVVDPVTPRLLDPLNGSQCDCFVYDSTPDRVRVREYGPTQGP